MGLMCSYFTDKRIANLVNTGSRDPMTIVGHMLLVHGAAVLLGALPLCIDLLDRIFHLEDPYKV